MRFSTLALAVLGMTVDLTLAQGPSVRTLDGNLLLVTDNGKSVGYRVGDGPVVQFDDLSDVNDTLTSVGYAMYRIGKDTCSAELSVQQAERADLVQAHALELADMATTRANSAQELYWIGREISPGSEFSNYSTLPASSADHSVIISGVGLAKYYHPNLHDSFQCTFTPDSGQAQSTLGSIVPSLTPYNSYGLSCPVPAMAAGRITISVIKFDGDALPFNGFAGRDTITAAQFWANLVSVTASGTLVEGAGFDTSKRYQCQYTGRNANNNGVVTFTGASTAVLNASFLMCEPMDTTFYNVGNRASAMLAVTELSVGSTVTIPRVALFPNSSVSWDTCGDGRQNGNESDTDCGGRFCAARCPQNSSCTSQSDCAAPWKCVPQQNNANICTVAPGPLSIPNSRFTVWPNGGGHRQFQDSNYYGTYTYIFGNDGSTQVWPYEHPTFHMRSIRADTNNHAAFQLYDFRAAGRFRFSCPNAFQMGIIWGQNPTTLHRTNSLEATTHLRAGNGFYLTTNGASEAGSATPTSQFHFYNGGAGDNSCRAGSRNREASRNLLWSTSEKLTITVGADNDADVGNRRRIKVWADNRLLYTANTLVPSGSRNLWSYIGKGYPSSLSTAWNSALPKFRFAQYR